MQHVACNQQTLKVGSLIYFANKSNDFVYDIVYKITYCLQDSSKIPCYFYVSLDTEFPYGNFEEAKIVL